MANKKFLVPLGLVSLASDPASGTEGDLYYNNVSDNVKLYKNGAWTDLVSSGNLPSGGATGQILAKSSNTDYAVEWIENYADYTETVKVRVKNNGSEALYQGQPVYVTGSDGTNVLVGKSSNSTESGSSKTLGLLEQNLTTNGQGFVIKEGKLGGLDTSSAGAVGDPVWLGADGALIYGLANKPVAPAHLVYIGVVTKKNGSTGEIFVSVQNGFELEELHNVGIGYGATIADNEILAYDTTSGLWINQTASEAGLATTGDITTAVGDYIPLSQKGEPQGVAELDIDGYVPATQLDLTAYAPINNATHTGTFEIQNQRPGISLWDTDTNKGLMLRPAVSDMPSHTYAEFKSTGQDETVAYESDLTSYLTSAVTSLTGTTNEIEVDASTGSVTIGIPTNPTLSGDLTVQSSSPKIYLNNGTNSLKIRAAGALTGNISFDIPVSGGTAVVTSDLSAYLTTSSAEATYQPIGSYLVASDLSGYLTSTTASSTYAPLSGATFTGDIAVNGGDITTTATTATLYNSNATTVNIGSAASAVSIGSTSHAGTTTIQHDLYVSGNITFGGSSTTLSATNLDVTDSLIYMAVDNTADILDIGWVGAYKPASTHLHTGFVRDASDGKWKLFSGVSAEPTTVVNFDGATYDTLKIGNLESDDATLTGTVSLPTATSIGNVSSTELGYLDGVTSAIQTQLDGKSSTSHTHTGVYQPVDADLTAIAALTGTAGFLTTNGSGSWSVDQNVYVTATNADNYYQPKNINLTGISNLSGTAGFIKTTAGGTMSVDSATYLTTTVATSTYAPLASPSFTTKITTPSIDLGAIGNITAQTATITTTSATALFTDTTAYRTCKYELQLIQQNTSSPVVESTATATTSTTTTSHTHTLPTGLVVGDIIVFILRLETSTTITGTLSTWLNPVSTGATRVYLKVSDGTETAVSFTTASSTSNSSVSYRVSNANINNYNAWTASSSNPPAMGTNGFYKTLVIAAEGFTSAGTITAGPSGYSTVFGTFEATKNTHIYSSYKTIDLLGTNTEDPGAFTTSGTISSPVSVTFAISGPMSNSYRSSTIMLNTNGSTINHFSEYGIVSGNESNPSKEISITINPVTSNGATTIFGTLSGASLLDPVVAKIIRTGIV